MITVFRTQVVRVCAQKSGVLSEALIITAISAIFCMTQPCHGAEIKNLSEPPEQQSLESIAPNLSGLFVGQDALLLVPDAQSFFVTASYQADATSRVQMFGGLNNQSRRYLPAGADDVDLVAADWSKDRILLFDGTAATVHEIATTDFKEVTKRSMPWDLIKPPVDRGGEPTRVETAGLRSKFKKQWLKTVGRKLAGVAPLPLSLSKGRHHVYLAATKIAGFPLVEITCGDGEAPSACMITRQCFLDGANELTPAGISGIAVSESRRMILIGDARRQMLVGFRYDSCLQVAKVKDYKLPPKLKTVSNLFIDKKDRLWVTTRSPDDYRNANVFFWPPSAW
jgi:hypothetical protein